MTIVAGTSRGLFVDGAVVALNDVDITALAHAGPTLYVGTEDGVLLRGSLDGDWVELGSTEGGRINCLLPDEERLWIGTTHARLLRHDGTELAEIDAFQDVAGRATWFTPWGGAPDVRSAARDASGSLFVNVHVGGIPATDDRGESWHPTIAIESDVHQVISADGLVVAATARGLAMSSDRGGTWASSSAGLHADYCRAVAISHDHVLLSCSTGPGGSRSALYRASLASLEFERCTNGLPEFFDDNIDTHTIAAHGDLVAMGAPDGHLYASHDRGVSWASVAGGLPPISALVVLDER